MYRYRALVFAHVSSCLLCVGVYAVVDVYGQCCELSIIPKDKVSVKSTPVMEEVGQEEEEKEENGL